MMGDGWGDGGWGWGAWVFMALMMVMFAALVAAVVIALVRAVVGLTSATLLPEPPRLTTRLASLTSASHVARSTPTSTGRAAT